MVFQSSPYRLVKFDVRRENEAHHYEFRWETGFEKDFYNPVYLMAESGNNGIDLIDVAAISRLVYLLDKNDALGILEQGIDFR